MQLLRTILDVLGYFSTVIVIISVLVGIYLWLRGIVPVLIRLGNGLSRRKIAVFATGDMAQSLEDLLHDSKLFDRANVIRITRAEDLGRAEGATLFLVYWPDWRNSVKEILEAKNDGTALVVYAPQDQGLIPQPEMTLLNSKRNVVVTNFRGRLLNDVVVCMITTSYEKK